MKLVYLLISVSLAFSVSAFANQDTDAFYGKVLGYNCNEERAIAGLVGTCLITIQSEEVDNAEPIGLVMHSDMYWDGGKFIRVGSTVFVDLSYTANKTAELKSYFSSGVSRIYYHDINASFGSYSDVIEVQRRD